MQYVVQEARDGFRPYGGAARMFACQEPEVMLSGPAETGKTYSWLWKLHLVCSLYPGAQCAIVRKTYKSAVSSVLQTYWDKIIGGEGRGVTRYGNNRPEFYDYPNGSRVWVGGMDNPDKVLSSERDLIYVNQAEELSLDEWETLMTRTTGRAGVLRWAQLGGDCNPSSPYHWIKHRKSLVFHVSRHVENPLLYDQLTGMITAQGQRTMQILDRLSGIRRSRLLDGLWVQAEGLVFHTWDESVNVIRPEKLPQTFDKITASQDWGFTKPGCFGVWGHDNDGRMYLLHQVYRTLRTVDWWTEQAVKLNARVHEKYGIWISRIACDPAEPDSIASYNAASHRADLVSEYGQEACRLPAQKAPNAVRAGIDRVNQRARVAGDGKPRLYIVQDSLVRQDPMLIAEKQPICTEQEVLEYVWNDKAKKEEPVGENDHGCDMMRYGVAAEDGIGEDFVPEPTSASVEIDEESTYGPGQQDQRLMGPRQREPLFKRGRR